MLAIGWPEIFGLMLAHLAGLADAENAGDAFDVIEAAGRTDGPGFWTGNFEAVVVDGIVRGGGHDAADAVFVVDREIDHGSIAQADVDDVHAGGADAIG